MAQGKTDIQWLWPILAGRAGLNPAAYRLDEGWSQRGERPSAMIERFHSDDDAVILKIVTKPDDPLRVEALQALQARAADVLGGTCRAPRVLAHDREAQAVLMAEAEGDRLFHLMEAADDHRPWLTRLGAWVAAFHRATLVEERQFKPAYNIKYIEKQLSAGKNIHQRKAFEICSKSVLSALPAFAGQPTIAAAQHGDANLHNFIWDGGALWGIDFTNPDVAPIGYDVARALLHYAVNLADHSKLRPGEAVPRAAAEAFFEGYDLTGPNDPSIQTILRARLVNDWVRFPASRVKQPIAQQIRFARAKAVLENIVRA
ncbi:MAG: aminoglycoside phosphotransferase family protein [Rhodobacteraceae bacterium]|nr:aminoglycoside phosphotransferase family protein [Paracoccaceae bacterium]